MSPDISAVRNQLIDCYQQLSAVEQEMLQLLSIAYGFIGRTRLGECFNQYRLSQTDQQSLAYPSIRKLINNLQERELVIAEGGQGIRCHPLVVEVVTRDAIRADRFAPMAQIVEEQQPIQTAKWNRNTRYFANEDQLIREVRFGLYRQDLDYIEAQIVAYSQYMYGPQQVSLPTVLQRVCDNPFDPDWTRTLRSTPRLYEAVLGSLLYDSLMGLLPAHEVFALLEEDCTHPQVQPSEALRNLWVEQLLLRGRLDQAEAVMERLGPDPEAWLLHHAWLHCLRGEYEQALQCGRKALSLARRVHKRRKLFFSSLSGVFFWLALLHNYSLPQLQEAEQYAEIIAKQHGHWLGIVYDRLETLVQVLQGEIAQKALLTHSEPVLQTGHSLKALIDVLCFYWVDVETAAEQLLEPIRLLYQAAAAAGYWALALEFAEVGAQLFPEQSAPNQPPFGQVARDLRRQTGIQPIASLIVPKQPWELSLEALIGLNPQPPQSQTPAAAEYRLAWFITFFPSVGWSLQPREQKITKRGTWSKGRIVALRRLAMEVDSFDYLTDQDKLVCSYLKANYRSYTSYDPYEFQEGAIAALVGHPLVFWEDAPTTRVELVAGEPELLIKQRKNGWLQISLAPPISPDGKSNLILTKETPTRLRVVAIKPEHCRIAEILGGKKNQLKVPQQAQERVLSAINAVSSLVTIHSDIGGGVADAESVPANPVPHVHLLPAGDGLKVALLNRPFPDGGPYYHPGTGGEMVVAEIDGRRLQTQRDLKQEKKLGRAVQQACSVLQSYPSQDGEWLIEAPDDCLELLLELQDLGDQVVVEWPEGERFRIAQRASLSSFNLQIKRQRDWFAASGELKISDDQVLDMQRLLELLEQTPGRFVALGEGQFLALTQEFRKRLEDLRAFSEKNGKSLRLHPLTALTLDDWVDEVGQLKTDKHWKSHLKRLRQVESLEPEVPSTLKADLRDYQIEGFQWLARLAHWGVGGCLADDMGLGKTLQALAVILTRAPEGPTLIVAPTSVGMNWLSEAERFAPTLQPINLRESCDRKATLNHLQPFGMVVCSYGLLQQEEMAQMLAEVQWRTIVLDEAQAIKNTATKRSKAAMNLKGDFKLITTGTPIENHLGELWNLFRFINPGLLGSADHFNQTFAYPIERYQDRSARERLKRLIQPFILRRTKAQVLDELPARTEVTLQVELSQREIAFYESLRREAVQKLTASDAEAGTKHLQVLAEITRLRRACCNPRLVQPDAAIPSAKLETFAEVLEELLSNHHKALVFSQFVDHLQIVRDYLDSQNVTYQYLDGSTPAKARQLRVEAFQAGEGDVFLISLKAGGTGLNLTAADYVIHLDPWWNPAVEDQASDRAHRIGQQRPVTIYRLVSQGTIEEKIVDLHRQKRDLADSLLQGADVSGKMSTAALLRLMGAE